MSNLYTVELSLRIRPKPGEERHHDALHSIDIRLTADQGEVGAALALAIDKLAATVPVNYYSPDPGRTILEDA